jgi:hypothetical protein
METVKSVKHPGVLLHCCAVPIDEHAIAREHVTGRNVHPACAEHAALVVSESHVAASPRQRATAASPSSLQDAPSPTGRHTASTPHTKPLGQSLGLLHRTVQSENEAS